VISYGVLALLVVLFALNMGGSNFAASFAAAHGGRIITKGKAQALFAVFVFLGAVTVGRPVATTLGNKIIPHDLLTFRMVIVVLVSATGSLFLANLLHVPQSTSMVTVAAIAGVGLSHRHVFGKTFFYIVPFWVLLPLAGYVLTYYLGRIVYPPRKSNFWIYERIMNHKDRLRAFVIIASCYNAFSVGTNNVANAVGPLMGAGIIGSLSGLALVAPVFGAGSVLFSSMLKTTGQKIVPLGLLTATIICLVTGTLMIIASLFGVPQSFVMIKVASLFAIGGLKNGHRVMFANPMTKKTYISWVIMPIVTLAVSFLLSSMIAP